ncbi:Uncharacterised protein [Mycobacteroides abscessus subsp. abscessus]|nr:Uncharacterised protein [Mycobacteroides abscessus subsp. abscessus]
MRSALVPQPWPSASGRSGMRPVAAARTSSLVVLRLPAAMISAPVVMIFCSSTAPVVSSRSTWTVQRPSAARSTSVTWCRVSTRTSPVASAAAM